MTKKLTPLAIKNSKPKRNAASKLARNEISDGGTGLWYIVQPSYARSWAERYRLTKHNQRKPQKYTYDDLDADPEGKTLAEIGVMLTAARAASAALRHRIKQGFDPAEEKRRAKAAARAVRPQTAEDSVEAQAERFLELHVRRKLRPATLRQYESVFRRLVLPKWCGRSVQNLRRRDVIALIEDIAVDRPIMANRCLGVISKFDSWLIGRDVIAASFTAGVEMPAVENVRDRVLDDGEIAALWLACEDEGVQGAVVRVMVATGARRSEIADTRFEEIDEQRRLLTIPAARMKGKREHKVPLPTLAWNVIAALPRLGPFVFSVGGSRPVRNFIRVKDRLDAKLKFARTFVLHDLRRSCASGLQRLGVRVEVIEAALAHASGSRAGITGTYQRHDYAEERRDALERWSDHIAALVGGGEPAKVVRLRAERP